MSQVITLFLPSVSCFASLFSSVLPLGTESFLGGPSAIYHATPCKWPTLFHSYTPFACSVGNFQQISLQWQPRAALHGLFSSHKLCITSPNLKVPTWKGWGAFWEILIFYACAARELLYCMWSLYEREMEQPKKTLSHCPPPPPSFALDPAGNAWSRVSLVTVFWLFQQMVSNGTSVSADLPHPYFFFVFFLLLGSGSFPKGGMFNGIQSGATCVDFFYIALFLLAAWFRAPSKSTNFPPQVMLYLYQATICHTCSGPNLGFIWNYFSLYCGIMWFVFDKNICPLLQAAVMSPPVDTSMSLHPTAMLTQQMGQLSLGSTGAVSKMDFTFMPYEP